MVPPLLQEVKDHDGGSADVFMGKRWERRRLLLSRLPTRVQMVRARAAEPFFPFADRGYLVLPAPCQSHFDLAPPDPACFGASMQPEPPSARLPSGREEKEIKGPQ